MEFKLMQPKYEASRALIVGIDKHQHASPLRYAVSDARATARALVESFGFPERNVTVLLDKDATKDNILQSYLAFASTDIAVDDRIIVFFAGHGLTKRGARGEVGYLVPFKGQEDDLSSLIRWDDLTRNADLIPAKHMLFVMDACYGGLAITRALAPGSMRFLKDMLLRPARQVLTAGKADEVVADSGGPIPNHSVFTGHFLEALQGKASSADGVITANGVMSYVYEKVSRDQHSHQTPHYGFLDGDGDFIFAAKILTELTSDERQDRDTLVAVPGNLPKPEDTEADESLVKELLSDPKLKIKLDDFTSKRVRDLIAALSDEQFSASQPISPQAIGARLSKYEEISSPLRMIASTIAHWGQPDHAAILRKIQARLCDQLTVRAGLVGWLGLSWYPLDAINISACIAALAQEKYDMLAVLMLPKVKSAHLNNNLVPITVAIEDGLTDAHRANAFKAIPGQERNYVPKSEYIYKVLQPRLEDLLFVGQDYEDLFDRAEIFRACVYADWRLAKGSDVWGPIGRFGWKIRWPGGGDPLTRITEEATRQGSGWPPLGAGFFNGDIHRFKKIADELKAKVLQSAWFV